MGRYGRRISAAANAIHLVSCVNALTDRRAPRAHDLAHLMSTTPHEALKMSTITTTIPFRAAFERTAALLLFVAAAAVVATGTVAMCAQPVLS